MDGIIFRGYASRDLDAIEIMFREKFGKEVEAFVIQPGFTVYGSRDNHNKIIESSLGGYAAVYIPVDVTRDELIRLEAERKVPNTARQREEESYSPEQSMFWDERKRYCFYCGQIFEADEMSDQVHCGKANCIQRHIDRIYAKQEVKAAFSRPHSGNNHNGVTYIAVTENGEQPGDDFTLDDPYSKTIEGWVYLIESENKLYKLGRSDDVWKRFGTLVAANAASLTMRHAIATSDYARAEIWLHKQFANKRHHGEWFSLSEEDISWFCQLEDGALDGV